jgi:hypothetical protein
MRLDEDILQVEEVGMKDEGRKYPGSIQSCLTYGMQPVVGGVGKVGYLNYVNIMMMHFVPICTCMAGR